MFAGVVEFNDSELSDSVGDNLQQQSLSGLAGIPFDDSGIWRHKGQGTDVTLVQQRQWNTAESKREQGIVCDAPTGTRILSWSRIDNRDQLIEQLGFRLNPTETDLTSTDAGLILLCWKQWREKLCEHLIGDFAFAIYESDTETLFLGRDHLGVRPLYFYQDGQKFVFATSLAVIANCNSLDLQCSEEWLARYILDCSSDWKISPYQHIEKVPPAHCLTYKGGERVQSRYFDFSDIPDSPALSDEGYVAEYLRLFSQAVSARVRSDYSVGSELSGGLDSSSVTAVAARQINNAAQNLYPYAVIRSEDEPACIELIKQSAEMQRPYVADWSELANIDFQAVEEEFINTVGTPIEQATAIAHSPFYRDAQQKGIRTLLSGFGGDEFTTSYASLGLTEFWQAGEYAKWLGHFRGGVVASKLRAIKWLCRYFLYGSCSASAQHLIKIASKRWQLSPLSHEVSSQYGLEEKNAKAALYDKGHKSINSFTLGNRWSPAMTARLENCSLMAARYGIEYRWPMLDIRLLTFFLSVPTEQKLGPKGMGRYLHRNAMADILPDEIIWRDKNMGATLVKKEESVDSACRESIQFPILKGLLKPDAESNLAIGEQSSNGLVRLISKSIFNRINHLERWLKARKS